MDRYFPNSDALAIANAMRAVNGFIDPIADHVNGLNVPVAAVGKSVSFGVENLSGDPQLDGLLARRDDGEAIVSLTSDTAITFCLSVFHRFDVDWKLHGFDSAALREIAEMTVQSLLTDPGQAPRTGLALRRFIARWLGPAIPLSATDIAVGSGIGHREATVLVQPFGDTAVARAGARTMAREGIGAVSTECVGSGR